MRKVAFVVFDIDNTIIDRFNLELITDLSGLGFKLKLSTIDSDVEDIITKVVQDKQEVKFKVHFINRAYEKSAVLEQWLEKYSTTDKKMALEYSDGVRLRYCRGKVTALSKTEKDEYNRLIREVTFRPTTPFFARMEQTIKISYSSTGKSYPYKYPYSYGAVQVLNNLINNTYILDVPVTVKITGTIENPNIQLLDEDGESYNRVQFSGVTLDEGDYIIINSADRKIWLYNAGEDEITDFTAYTDPSYDTFLRARPNMQTTISINLNPSDTGELTGMWEQYGL